MSKIKHNFRKLICCFCGVIFFSALHANSATLPPDPDNAALLYYQAFLLLPEPDAATTGLLDNVLSGAEPDEQLGEYLEHCRETIELAKAASEMPECIWGIRYSQGLGARLPQAVQLRSLSRLLSVDARILAAEGDYQAAFGRCLTIRRLAEHIGDDMVVMYSLSLGVDRLAQRCIQYVLGFMPPDAETLTWLQGQFAVVHGASKSPARVLEIDLELALQSLRTDPDTLAWIREQLVKNTGDDSNEEVQSLTDEELLAYAQEPYADFLNSVFRAMGSDMSYEEKYVEIQRLTDELKEEFGTDPAVNQIITACADQVIGLHNLQVRHIADFNALKAAIEIYLVQAKTGQLPKILPAYLPEDPFSGQDFGYNVTDEGFSISFDPENLCDLKVRQFEFIIAQ